MMHFYPEEFCDVIKMAKASRKPCYSEAAELYILVDHVEKYYTVFTSKLYTDVVTNEKKNCGQELRRVSMLVVSAFAP
jgi:hypothetical protein